METRRTTLLALTAVILTLGALWFSHRPVNPEELAHNLGLSLRGANFLISKLQREGKLS